MLPLPSDEDLDGTIVKGLLFHSPAIDLVRVHDAGLCHTPDPDILEFAATHGRVIVTHDRNTMTAFARHRLGRGLAMAGVIVVDRLMNLGRAIQELGTFTEAGEPGDLDGQIIFLS